MTSMHSNIEIRKIIQTWLNNVFKEVRIPQNVIAFNFQLQRTPDEFEMFLTGHDDFYYEHDTWILSEVYSPNTNFQGLGIASLSFSDQEMFAIYKQEVIDFITNKIDDLPIQVHYFNVKYPGGIPELFYERQDK